MIFGCLVQQNTYLMELLLSEYKISNILKSSEEKMDTDAVVLWVLHADKVPPHIGVSVHGAYFSLKANGKDLAMPVDHIQRLIDRKKIATLCFELTLQESVDHMTGIFDFYEKTEPNTVTCLNPIKELLHIEYAQKLTELLDVLYANNKISRVFGFHLPYDFKGIANYSTDDIHARLSMLSND